MNRFFLLIAALLAALASGAAAAAPAPAAPAGEPVYLSEDEAFAPELTQDGDAVRITFAIADGYYLYRERFAVDCVNCAIAAVDIPAGTYHEDEYMGPSHVFYGSVGIAVRLASTDPFPKISVRYQGCTEGMCYPPITRKIAIDRIAGGTASPAGDASPAPAPAPERAPDGGGFTSFADLAGGDAGSIYRAMGDSLVLGVGAFLLFGVLLSLTPCMFPMYPIWSSVILGSRRRSRGTILLYTSVYILGMAAAYMLAGFAIARAGAEFQLFLQRPAVLAVISVFFLVFAISLFGLFEVSLPSAWINRLQRINDRQKGGTVAGVFVMGVISAVVATPCTTAPLAGALMFIMKDGDMLRGGLYLFAMGLGMGAPLVIIALLGERFLPESGMWMKNIKVICGFIMLIVPVYLMRAYLSPGVISALAILMSGSIICYAGYQATGKKGFAVLAMTVTALIAGASLFLTGESARNALFRPVRDLAELDEVLRGNDVVIVDVRADWCAACVKYEKTTFADERVAGYLAPVATVSVDITDADAPAGAIVAKYREHITGAPTILIFSKSRVAGTITGYLGPEPFLEKIRGAVGAASG